ncbi:RNase adapter RapZ [Ideonella livida]|uniref:RNase adapter RapZ n=1 Tax=Ideonella livida TaxID=2707176 RepID=A0A7C9TME0_9BURK|nr:RNase adapter RapZ [Ideonella livida]NDY92267.1 RNase adapter RapZ [Ideonella livida]
MAEADLPPRPNAHDLTSGPASPPVPEATFGTEPDGTERRQRAVVLVTGISGSGKSVALHALEDAGFFCVDNLPPELLRDFIRVESLHGVRRMAIAVDVRTAGSLPFLLPVLDQLREDGVEVRSLFLDANTPSLIKRFSETRRPHPLSKPGEGGQDPHRALLDAIDLERELLADLRERSTVLDTSLLRPAQLRHWVRDLVQATGSRLTLVFQSFAFKHGVPLDADLVYDVRVLPNPFYVRELRAQTGRDDGVAQYLKAQPEVGEMTDQIATFIRRWLPAFQDDQRSYLTVAIGCTGGQHRSVYLVETLAARFQSEVATLTRHRELDAKP